MNEQKIFDKVALHLLTQNERSQAQFVGDDRCKYRNDMGLKCAIGCLIPDEIYNSRFEGLGVFQLIESNTSIRTLFHGINLKFLEELQRIHDCSHVDNWANSLIKCATKYNLQSSVVQSFKESQ